MKPGKAASAGSFPMRPIGTVRSPYSDRAQVPKGAGAKHDAEGVLEIGAEFEEGLKDIEGFSHLYVLWVFHRAEGYELVAAPTTAPLGWRRSSTAWPSSSAGFMTPAIAAIS